eukprot:scaffold281_cov318-Pavlova_lutheri.AAC.65
MVDRRSEGDVCRAPVGRFPPFGRKGEPPTVSEDLQFCRQYVDLAIERAGKGRSFAKGKASDLCDAMPSMQKVPWKNLLRKRAHGGKRQVDSPSKGAPPIRILCRWR